MTIISEDEMLSRELCRLRKQECWQEIWNAVVKQSNKNHELDIAVAAEGAFALAQLGQLGQAAALAKNALQQAPSFLAMRALVLVRLKQKAFEEALALAKAVFQPPFQLATPEDSALALLTLASVHNALKNTEIVRQLALESLQAHPMPNTYFLLGVTELSAGNTEQGLEALHAGLTLSPDNINIWLLLGNTYTRLNQLEKTIQTYENALEYFPENPDVLSTLGEWYARIHRHAEAEMLLRKVTQIHPTHTAGWINLGKLLYTTKAHDEGVKVFNTALQLSPNSVELMFNAGRIMLKNDSEDKNGRELIKKAYVLSPENITIASQYILICEDEGESKLADVALKALEAKNQNMSSVYKCHSALSFLRCEYDNGLTHIREALKNELWFLQQQPRLSLFGDGAHPPMDVYDAGETLLAVCAFLEKLGVPYFLAAGTLLGIVRDGELLPHDKDADLGIAWDVDREWLMQQIEDSDELALNGGKRPDPDFAEWNFSVLRKGTPIGVDFFFYKPDGDDWLTGQYCKPSPWLQRFKQRPLTTVNYRGHMLSIPENPEGYLEEVYGPEWRTPMPCYDTLVAADNLCPEAFLTAKIIGYNRLYEVLMNRSWKKVLWYCEALKRFDNPPILDELANWLREAMPTA